MARPNSRIAIVDDDAVYVAMLAEALSDEGYQTMSCFHADEAYPLLARELPDLVLLDVRMTTPTSGWEILLQLREDPSTAELPVILCTADLSFVHRHAQELARLPSALLIKPFALGALFEQIARCLMAADDQARKPASEQSRADITARAVAG